MSKQRRHWREVSDEIFAAIASGDYDQQTYRRALTRWIKDHPGVPRVAVLHADQRLGAHYALIKREEAVRKPRVKA